MPRRFHFLAVEDEVWALRVGAHPDGADPLLNLVVSMPSSKGYRPVQSLEFLSFLGIRREDLTPGWQVTDADRRYTERLLALRRWGRKGMLLGVDPAVGRQGIRPSPEKLAWIVEKIAESRPVVPLVLSDDLASSQVREPPLHLPPQLHGAWPELSTTTPPV